MLPTLTKKGIELVILLKEGDVSFQADTDLMEQVLINLLVNSIEAVKEREAPKIILSAGIATN
jgi:two-component system nitrogen regulation sensor histidine kinase NtrY